MSKRGWVEGKKRRFMRRSHVRMASSRMVGLLEDVQTWGAQINDARAAEAMVELALALRKGIMEFDRAVEQDRVFADTK